MIPYEKAKQLVLEKAKPLGRQKIKIEEALGLVAAATIKAKIPLPPFTNSAVDGYAVRSEDTLITSAAFFPKKLKLLAEERAGEYFRGQLKKGVALKVMTGAPIPDGADAVIPREETEEGPDFILVKREVKKGENIRLAGEDVKKGEKIVEAGTWLRPSHLGLLAACGFKKIYVHPPPKILALVTGDELAEPGQPLKKGMIYDSNSALLQALIKTSRARPVAIKRVKDRLVSLIRALKEGREKADIILTSGGVSVGDYDLVKMAAEKLGAHQVFWQVAQKPAKPLAFYILKNNGKNIYLFGLPGNPGAVVISFEEYVRPFIKKMMGRGDYLPQEIEASLTHPFKKKRGRLNFLRVKLKFSDGQWQATSTGAQESGILSSLTETQGLALIPAEADFLAEGTKVKVHLFEW